MKTETKFTKGPWNLVETETKAGNPTHQVEAEGLIVAYALPRTSANAELMANARLIAAAPSLFEALNKLVTIVGAYDNGQMLPTPIVVAAQEAQAALALVEKGATA